MEITMSIQKLRRLFGEDIGISKVVCYAQRWNEGFVYPNYLSGPRPDHGLAFVMSDSVEYTLEDESVIKAVAGDIVYLPRGSKYKIGFGKQSDTGTDMYLINFMLDRECDVRTPIILMHDASFSLVSDFAKAVKVYNRSVRASLALKSNVYRILDSVIFKNYSAFSDKNAVEMGVLYIENNIDKSIGITELASFCHMSESTFRREFTKHTGMSPLKYINSLKVEKAKELLKNPEFNIADLPETLGFYDLAHFYKVFALVTGSTPAVYRKSIEKRS